MQAMDWNRRLVANAPKLINLRHLSRSSLLRWVTCKLEMGLQWLSYSIDAIEVIYVSIDDSSSEWPAVEREMLVVMKPSW